MNLGNRTASFWIILVFAAAQWDGVATAEAPRTRETVTESARTRRTSSHESRKWTSTAGKTVEGRLVGLDGESAGVFNRSLMKLRFADLSQADLDYLESLRQSLQLEEERLRTAAPAWKTDAAELATYLAARLKDLAAPGGAEAVSTESADLPTFDKVRIGGNQVFVERDTWTLGIVPLVDGRLDLTLSTRRSNNAVISEGFSIQAAMADERFALVRPLLGETVIFEMGFEAEKPLKSGGNVQDELKRKEFDPELLTAAVRPAAGRGLQLQFEQAKGLEHLISGEPGVFGGPFPLVAFDVTTSDDHAQAWKKVKAGTRIKWSGIVTGAYGGVVTKHYPNDHSSSLWWIAVTIEDATPSDS